MKQPMTNGARLGKHGQRNTFPWRNLLIVLICVLFLRPALPVQAAVGDIRTVADTDESSNKGDDGPATVTRLSAPQAVAVDVPPAVTWNTFLGGSGDDAAYDATVDANGNLYVVGTSSAAWGTPIRAYSLHRDTFIAKLDANGVLQWVTFLGGSGNDDSLHIAVDRHSNIFVAGVSTETWGTPLQTGGRDFIAKLNPQGILQWHTFTKANPSLTSSNNLVVDSNSNIYIVGNSDRSWGTPVHPFSSWRDHYVAKFNEDGIYQWHTFIGADAAHFYSHLALDSSGNLYVAGTTGESWSNATPLHGFSGALDGFLAKLNPNGILQWHTFLGGAGHDISNGVALDQRGYVYVVGSSTATWGTPKQGAAPAGFVAKLDSNGTLQWNSFTGDIGGSLQSLAISDQNRLYLASEKLGWMDEYGFLEWNTNLRAYYSYDLLLDGRGHLYIIGADFGSWGSPIRPHDSTSRDATVYQMNNIPSGPALSIPNSTIQVTNNRISVPVQFTGNGAGIASVGFSLDYQQSCLRFDATDSDGNGIPNNISGLPTGFAWNISHDATDSDGELDLSVYDDSLPIATLSNGTLLTVAFDVLPACVTTDGSTTDVTVNFSNNPAASFGNASANKVAGTAVGGTLTLRFNATPTDISLSPSSVDENVANGTTVGTLTTTDPDADNSHTYTLVTGTGSDDNASFTIANNTLRTAAIFDFETKNSYTVRVRATDDGGLSFEKAFTIAINNLYEAPTSISFDAGNGGDDGNPNTLDINENKAAGATVATFAPGNPNTGSSYTFALVAGPGDTDNDSFTFVGNELQSIVPLDAEKPGGYTIRVQITDQTGNRFMRITDQTGNSFVQVFTIQVNSVNETPVAVDDSVDPRTTVVIGGAAQTINVLANDSDPDVGDTLTVASVTQPAAGSVVNNSSQVSFSAPYTNGATSFTYQATDGALTSSAATVTVNYVKNDLRGDCNSDNEVGAADYTAIVFELFDAGSDPQEQGKPAWWRIYAGGYPGSPLGCDANASRNDNDNSNDSVGASDIVCTVQIFFGDSSCTQPSPTPAGSMTTATLRVPQAQMAQAGRPTSVALTLDSAGHEVAAAAFALRLDPQRVHFDPTDGDGDGVPDAVTLNVPARMTRSVTWNAATHRLEVALFGVTLPLPTLTDGVLATVTLTVAADAPTGSSTPLTLEQVSLGDAAGRNVTVTAVDGSLTIDNLGGTPNKLFLPLTQR